MENNIWCKGWGAIASAVLAILTGALLILPAVPVWADDKLDAEQLVEKSRITFQSLAAEKDMEGLVALVKNAKGVLIYPPVLRGAFIFGASGGTGALLAYDASAKKWGGQPFIPLEK